MNHEPSGDILRDVASYYTEKLEQHGETPRGVDWNGEESQQRRFAQLLKIIDTPAPKSLNDLGCGYGALFDVVKPLFPEMQYIGYDVSAAMVDAARRRYAADPHASFVVASEPAPAEYGVASGILNVRMGYADSAWHDFFVATLDTLDRSSTRGFAFNCLTSYSDADKQREYLYYANPLEWFDFCKRRYSRNVALLHDYGLYEFTLLVRKDV